MREDRRGIAATGFERAQEVDCLEERVCEVVALPV
jgi:hypothetical protein